MESRTLNFKDFDDALAELDRLYAGGYEKCGQWDLAQTCDHLTYFILGSLDGASYRVPWLLKVLFGRMALGRILKQRRMKANMPSPQKPLPEAGGDEAAAVARFRQVVQRFAGHQGEFHASPFFGY